MNLSAHEFIPDLLRELFFIMPKREKKQFSRLALWIARIALGAAFIIIWVWLYNLILDGTKLRPGAEKGISIPLYWITIVAGGVLAGAVAVFSAAAILSAMFAIYKAIEKALSNYSGRQIFMGVVGLIAGLGIVLIIALIFKPLTEPRLVPIPIFMCILLGFMGFMLGMRRMSESSNKDKDKGGDKSSAGGIPKILDSSVLIDGRILDVAKTGFVDGPFIIPAFIIDELRRITDNADVLKRNRGKRGIDIINAMQQEKNFEVIMSAQDYGEGDTDFKLLKLAEDLKAKIITNDYNLNKVAALKEIQVLNINELNNAIKPIALPGEKMRVKLVKEGKEAGQAVAYLEDGTMIVVENGGKNIGQEVDITITTALQTAAGRLIFGRI